MSRSYKSPKLDRTLHILVIAHISFYAAVNTVYFILYNVSGYFIRSDHQLYRVTPLKTPFGLLIPLLQSQSHVTTITHNYILRCYTCTQLKITYTFVTTITCSTLARLHSLRALHSILYFTIAHKVS
jgi:hypothetical protein